uniref:Uncharacterized protein n=1 Tax=Kalanchoe fedtschenkoi TaxID=63787 RepID=A0A7N0ZS45_KALFE
MGVLEVADNFGSSVKLSAVTHTMGMSVENGLRTEIEIVSHGPDVEDAREELRSQLLHRDLAQRELEFLLNAGDPLEFRFGHASSVSVQSTSLTGRHHGQIVTSKAKADMSLIGALTHSDEPTLRQRGKVCDANSAESLFLLAGNQRSDKVENNSINLNIKRNVAPSEQSSRVEGTCNCKEYEESTIFRPYARRNRSKLNREVSSSGLIDVIPSQCSVHVTVPSRYGLRDTRGSLFDSNHVDRKISSNSDEKSTSSNPDKFHMVTDFSNLDSKRSPTVQTAAGVLKVNSNEGSLDVLTSAGPLDDQKGPIRSGDANRCLNVAVVGQGGLRSNGFPLSKNANKNDEGDAVVMETESQGLQGNTQNDADSNASAVPNTTVDSESINRDSLSEGNTCPVLVNAVLKQPLLMKKGETVDKKTIKNANEHDTGQIAIEGDKSHLQNRLDNKFEVKVPGTSEMSKDFQPGATLSTVSAGTRSYNPEVSGIVSDHDAPEPQTGCTKELEKVDDDSILAEALLIEAKRRRIAELLGGTLRSEGHQKSHWQFVLEEMAWLANDFMQERLWKSSAASQFGHRAALASRQRVEEKMPIINLRAVAQSNARAVLQFWQSVESVVYTEDKKSVQDRALLSFNTNEAAEDQSEESKVVQEPKLEFEQHGLIKSHAIRKYAIRFLKYNASVIPYFNTEAWLSPDLKSTLGTEENKSSLRSYLADESLFYKVPAGAMESYGKSIESHVLQCEVSCSGLQEAERPFYYATEEHMYMGEEEELEAYYLPSAFEGSKASKTAQKKRKNPVNFYLSEIRDGAHLTFVGHPSGINSRCVPTKHTRTASRLRLLRHYDVGVGGNGQLPDRTDASSEDTNSFQDDQSTLSGDYKIEYAMDFEKHVQLDTTGDLRKSKKKKIEKHREDRWQLDTALSKGHRDFSKRRLDSRRLECIGINGTVGEPNAKRPKTVKQTLESSFESPGFNNRMVPSPVASQISNKPHPFKIMRMIGGRDRARGTKSLKVPSGQPSSENLWSSFEDQALVVLVHDLGPNWKLVSDAMNSALQFVCIFRNPGECKERHKVLMDLSTDAGADSAEDSGSSQPYPSTLPGIPKGSARQLFQRLQGPMEEDTLKSHFEKIMLIRQKQHCRKNQKNDVRDLKQIVPNHNSHAIAVSEVCSNYLHGGYLTPLDLCDPPPAKVESLTHGHQGPESVQPAIGSNSLDQGTFNLVNDSDVPHVIGPHNASVRTSSLTNEMRKSSATLPRRSAQHSSLSACLTSSGTDRNNVRMAPGTNSVGMMTGLSSQSLPISGPGFEVNNVSPMPNARSISSSSMVGMPNYHNLRVNSSQGTSTSNSSGGYMTLNQESQRQILAPELNICAPKGNNRGTTPLEEIRSNLSGHSSTPMGQTHPVCNQLHQVPSHQSQGLNNYPRSQGPSVSQHPSYARLVKERQFPQQLLMGQQYSPLNPTTSISQSPKLLQTPLLGSLPLSPSPITPPSQSQQKHHLPPHGLSLTQSGLSGSVNQTVRHGRQPPNPFQQSVRPHHPQQTQHQQLTKFTNGLGLGTANISVPDNSSNLNRMSPSSGGHADQRTSVQGRSSFSGSISIPSQPFRPLTPQSSGHALHQKGLYSSVPTTNPSQQTPSDSEKDSENEISSRYSAHRSLSLNSIKSGAAMSGGSSQLLLKSKSLQKKGCDRDRIEKEQQQSHIGNTDQQSKGPTDLDRADKQIMHRSPCGNTPTALPHLTRSTGHASVTSSSVLLRTESELYDSVLQNFDNQMSSSAKPAMKLDPTGNQGQLQRQLSNTMTPSQKKQKPSQQPDHTEVQGNMQT